MGRVHAGYFYALREAARDLTATRACAITFSMFRMVLVPAAALSVIALTACSSSRYDQIRVDAEPWTQAHGECRRAADAVVQTPLRQITMRHAYDECMRERGWERGEQVPHRAYRRI